MDKNENGYPTTDGMQNGVVGGVTGGSGGGCSGGGVGGVGGANHTCGGDGSCLDYKPLAYVYAPDQMFRMLYSANDALKHGTLFEELYKPREVYGRE